MQRVSESIKKKSDDWHRGQFKLKSIKDESWEGLGLGVRKYTTGKYNHDASKNTKKTWIVEEILNSKDLQREGNAMRHCVYSYHRSCSAGTTSIFSMKSQDDFGSKYKNLTFEVDNRAKRIVQARGLANRSPRATELNILKMWAAKHNFRTYTGY